MTTTTTVRVVPVLNGVSVKARIALAKQELHDAGLSLHTDVEKDEYKRIRKHLNDLQDMEDNPFLYLDTPGFRVASITSRPIDELYQELKKAEQVAATIRQEFQFAEVKLLEAQEYFNRLALENEVAGNNVIKLQNEMNYTVTA